MKTKLAITIVIAILLAASGYVVWFFVRDHQQAEHSDSVFLSSLADLPGVSQDVVQSDHSLIKIEEPFLYDHERSFGNFVVTILANRNFGGIEEHYSIEGDAKTLQDFVNEVRYVESPSNSLFFQGPWQATKGAGDAVASLVNAVRQIVRHPYGTVKGLWNGGWAVAQYGKNWYEGEVHPSDDITELTGAWYLDLCCRVSREHSLDFLDLKTERAKAAMLREANSRITGRAPAEIALLLLPFSELKYGAKAGEITVTAESAGEAGQLAEDAEVATEANRLVAAEQTVNELAADGAVDPHVPGLIRYHNLFEESATAAEETIDRLKYAGKSRQITMPVATLGWATDSDYAETFFGAHPELRGQVVIHHAIPQEVMKRYPGIITEEELHSLENLRGIPKRLDNTLHKSLIAREWNEFYRVNPAATMSKEKLLQEATEIDFKFGTRFNPPIE